MGRAGLLLAIKALLRARTEDERAAAAKAATLAVQSYLDSEEVRGEAPGADTPERMAARAQMLDGLKAPLGRMSDDQLADFNELLPWAAQTADPRGRVVGEAWSARKRAKIARPIDLRHEAFNAAFPLAGRHVLEVGCFEGIHSISLMLLGARVTAADARLENVVKTLARTWAYGMNCEGVLWDLEEPAPPEAPEAWDVLHHIGVLYHQTNPVESLCELLPRTRQAVLLDTHVANEPAEADRTYEAGGKSWRYAFRPEPFNAVSPFAGMRDHAKYLVVEDLMALISAQGFKDVRLADNRDERNGRRVAIWAFR
jgi:tRNA (mo5U34)-methyltransferase